MRQYHLQNRTNREIKSDPEIKEILKNGKFTVISMCRDNEPYIVTLSYGFDANHNALYFHCATKGLKLDFIKSNPTVCATVIDDGGYVTGQCEHNYKTVVFWGQLKVVTELEERAYGMEILLNHLEKDSGVIANYLVKSNDQASKMEILRLDITQIHGKAGK
jgi:uncharacterized protein